MLVAKRKSGQLFSLLNDRNKEQLLALRRQESFYCPVCDSCVQMRLGDKRSWHFAHQSKANCSYAAEAESAYHLQGKRLLYCWLEEQGVTVRLEPYLPRLKQRPDLLLHTHPLITALEFQCATIDSNLLAGRTKTFQRFCMLPIWILGGNRLHRTGSSTFHIHQMDWLALRKILRSQGSVFLIYFCPEAQKFAVLTHVIPIGSTKTFARLAYYPMSAFSIHQLYHVAWQEHQPLMDQWLALKKHWRQSAYRYHTHAHFFVQKRFGHLSLFPSAAGWPTRYLYHIETPCFLWQSWLFDQFYLSWPQGKKILLQNVMNAFHTLVRQHIFQVREFPLIQDEDASLAILQYLRCLTALGFLKEKRDGVFYKANDVRNPQDMDHSMKLDREYFMKLNGIL